MDRTFFEKWASFLLCLFLGGLSVLLAFRYLLPLLFPFAVGILLAYLSRSLAKRASKKLPCGLLATLILTLILLCLGLLLRALIKRLLEEGSAFLASLPELEENLRVFWERLGERFGERESPLRASLQNALPALLERLFSGLADFVATLLSNAPGIFFSIAVILIVAYLFAAGGFWEKGKLIGVLPERVEAWLNERLPRVGERVKRLSFRYFRAYLYLFLITWGELLLGFFILRVKYAFLLSFLIAFVDLLPVLGTGSVLIPWSVVQFFQGNAFLGGGLLVLYGIILLARQFLEPHLVGKSLGLHPILTLFFGYAGWRFFGVFGMLAGPIVPILLRGIFANPSAQNERKRQAP